MRRLHEHHWQGNPRQRCSVRAGYAAWRPAASSLTASVVSGLPPMPHSPLLTSEIFTQVPPRMFSPSIETMASVNFWMICRFCSGLNTFSIKCTSISGIVAFLHLGPARSEDAGDYAHRTRSRLSESYDLVSRYAQDIVLAQ